jgi:hypothetical protein
MFSVQSGKVLSCIIAVIVHITGLHEITLDHVRIWYAAIVKVPLGHAYDPIAFIDRF